MRTSLPRIVPMGPQTINIQDLSRQIVTNSARRLEVSCYDNQWLRRMSKELLKDLTVKNQDEILMFGPSNFILDLSQDFLAHENFSSQGFEELHQLHF
jgi:hypothetical protein